MALTFGFYNSVNGDRKYDAVQHGSFFDGIIKDGIYETIGDSFKVESAGDMKITVGTGRAWFNHTWTLNDSKMVFTLDASDLLQPRIDTVILETNSEYATRANRIYILKGTPSANPSGAMLKRGSFVNQYPLARIRVNAQATSFTQSAITNTRGTTECPFVIGVLTVLTIDNLISQWSTQWNEWLQDKTQEIDTWEDTNKASFDTWFNGMKNQLTTDAAGNLQTQINTISTKIDDISKYTKDNATLYASRWSNGTYTISNPLVTEKSMQMITPSESISKDQYKALSRAEIIENGQTAGSFKLKCLGTVPTVDIPLTVIYFGDKFE